MGFLWDLVQHSQIQEQGERTGTLEARVKRLEDEFSQTRQALAEAFKRIEARLGDDVDGDGKVGPG